MKTYHEVDLDAAMTKAAEFGDERVAPVMTERGRAAGQESRPARRLGCRYRGYRSRSRNIRELTPVTVAG